MTINENDLIFAKVKEGAVIPSKDDENAGYDIYPCFLEDYMYFKPHETKLVPTGIASALNNKYYIQIQERGSTGSKGMKYGAGVIDASYRGEWFIVITNTNDIPMVIAKEHVTTKDIFGEFGMRYIIYPYSKAIAQGIVHEVPQMNVTELTYQELLMIESERGTRALGSSGK
jgi:dUTP pyrophosphatase